MELRAEPRFETRSPAVVEVIRDKVYTYDATITEVSGVGLRIETPEELRVGETIRLLVNSYHMFAQVRGSKPGDSGFVIGLERIDAWNGPAPGASAPEKMAAASPVPVVGRPALKKPLDNLHRAALRELFANPRFRTVPRKYQTVIIAAGCIAVAGWAGIGALLSLRSKSQSTTHAEAAPVTQLPGAPNSNAVVTNPVASIASSKPVIAPPVQTARVAAPPPPAVQPAPVAVAPPVQTARAAAPPPPPVKPPPAAIKPPVQTAHVAAPPPPVVRPAPVAVAPPVQTARAATPPAQNALTARPAAAAASKISIKASDVSWVTACVDGTKVLDTLLTKGYVGAIPFSRQATVRFGNAGAIELAVGNQPAAKLGPAGEVRTIKATPGGYELITITSAFNCNIH